MAQYMIEHLHTHTPTPTQRDDCACDLVKKMVTMIDDRNNMRAIERVYQSGLSYFHMLAPKSK